MKKANTETVLAQLVTAFGIDIVNAPHRLKILLEDFSIGRYRRREIRILLLLAEQGHVSSLAATENLMQRQQLRSYLSNCLVNESGVDQQLAEWGVTAWLSALFGCLSINTGMDVISNNGSMNDFLEPALRGQTEAHHRLEQFLHHDMAIYRHGQMHKKGQGVVKELNQAVGFVARAAEQGIVKAQLWLADMYFYGCDTVQDEALAAYWYRKAALAGHALAMHQLGVLLERGGDPEAAVWFHQAAKLGHPYAQAITATAEMSFNRALVCDAEHRYAEAFALYLTAAQQGYVKAHYQLAEHYLYGHGQRADEAKAVEHYLCAAEQDDIDAQYKLGNLYESGVDNVRDYVQAAFWYHKAAQLGHIEAQFRLGCMYEHGVAVPTNFTLADAWYRKSAEHGYVRAAYHLGSLCHRLIDPHLEYRPDHEREGRETNEWYEHESNVWISTAAENGHLGAICSIGWSYYYSEDRYLNDGVAEDYYNGVAESYFGQAAKFGSEEAMMGLEMVSNNDA